MAHGAPRAADRGEWEAEHGALTDAELAEADALIDEADQGARRPAGAP